MYATSPACGASGTGGSFRANPCWNSDGSSRKMTVAVVSGTGSLDWVSSTGAAASASMNASRSAG